MFTDIDTTADINENNSCAITSIPEGDNMLFIKQILRHFNMALSMLNNKVEDVSWGNHKIDKRQ
jgi:hypothetical protein